MSTGTDLSCPACGAPLQTGDRFCERCGARLPESPPAAGSRVELDFGIAAVVSDQGLKHHRNEDSFQLQVAGERNVAVVVCDGISSASAGNVAARDAAAAAAAVLGQAISDQARDASAAIDQALQAAAEAVVLVEWTTRTRRVDPSCTLVCAIYRDGEITIGWAGDSRAYWFDAEEGIAKGLLTPEQAAKSPFMHSITHWVGPDAPERPPRTVSLAPERRGRLLLCTDGLWNYAPSADELRDLIDGLPAGATPVAVAHALTDVANERGGHDNVTVAVVDVDPRP